MAPTEAASEWRRHRYVAVCQQVLAFAFVVIALLPAASVVNLDVVHDPVPTEPASLRWDLVAHSLGLGDRP